MPKATAKKSAAKKTVAAAKPKTEEVAIDGRFAHFSEEDQAKVKELLEAGVALTGEETTEDLDAHLAALEEDNGSDAKPVKEDKDCPNKMTPRYQPAVIEGKQRRFPIHFVHTANGKSALYNEFGVRISPVYGPEDVLAGSTDTNAVRSINRAAAKNNAERRKSMLPGDYLPAV